jgi:hypothetical protein
MTKRRSPTIRLVQDVVDDSKTLWDRRVPYPIERGLRRVSVSHISNEDRTGSDELSAVRQQIAELTVAVDRLLALQAQG